MLHFELDESLVDYKIVSFLALQRRGATSGVSPIIALCANSVAQQFFDSVTPRNVILKHSLNYLFRADELFQLKDEDSKRQSDCWSDNYFDALVNFFRTVKRKKGFDNKKIGCVHLSAEKVFLKDAWGKTIEGTLVLPSNHISDNPISFKTFPFYPIFNPQKYHKNGLKKGRRVLVPVTIVGRDEEDDGYKVEFWNKNGGLFGEFVVAAEDIITQPVNHHGKC